jgi:hypothetical protein
VSQFNLGGVLKEGNGFCLPVGYQYIVVFHLKNCGAVVKAIHF